MNWDTRSLRSLINHKPLPRQREKIQLQPDKDEAGNNITFTRPPVLPPETSDWHKEYGPKQKHHA